MKRWNHKPRITAGDVAVWAVWTGLTAGFLLAVCLLITLGV